MNYKLISKAVSNIKDTFLIESLVPPGAQSDYAPERILQMHKYESRKRNPHSRHFLRLVLAACLTLTMALTTYACNIFGIRDFLTKLPDSAELYIQEHTETKLAEDWSARITESLCDETKIMVTVTVSGGEKYIIAPTDADPETLAVNIGIQDGMTLGEYAAQQGKQLLFVGAKLKQDDSLGSNGSQSFHNASDNEMTILITANKSEALTEKEITCHVYAVDEQWNKMTLDIPFMLSEAPSSDIKMYEPVNPNKIPGITVGDATVTETPLGYIIHFHETVTNEEAFYNIMKVEFEGLTYSQGGSVRGNDGNWYFTATGCAGELNEKLVLRYYDWDNKLIGELTFIKK